MSIKVTCFGATGSICAPSTKEFDRTEFGGNTTCYYVEAGPFNLIFDMGAGARILGAKEFGSNKMFLPDFHGKNYLVWLSHWHRDHTEGLPFCAPIYHPSNSFWFFGLNPRQDRHGDEYVENKIKDMLEYQQSTPFFPVPFRELPANKKFSSLPAMFSFTQTLHHEPDKVEEKGKGRIYPISWNEKLNNKNYIKLTSIPLNHPDGCLGLRVDYLGKSVCFVGDNEPFVYPNKNVAKLCKDADILFADGQYSEEQIGGMCQGFGHGTLQSCLKEAEACNAKQLVVSHHDPSNNDQKLRDMEKSFEGKLTLAREGQIWSI